MTKSFSNYNNNTIMLKTPTYFNIATASQQSDNHNSNQNENEVI